MLDTEELKRRLDALRRLRGLRQEDLAQLVHEDGFGKHDVGRIERGDPTLPFSPGLRRSIAGHLGVPERWFTDAELGGLLSPPEPSGPDLDIAARLDRMQAILDRLEQWESAPVWQRVADSRAEAIETLNERLKTMEASVEAMRGKLEEISPTLTPAERLARAQEEAARRSRELREQLPESPRRPGVRRRSQ